LENRLVARVARPTALTSSSQIACSQQGLALQRVYVIDDAQRFVANQPFSLLARSFSQSPTLLMQRKLTYVNIEALSGAPQFPTWG
jgi:hypothetical protein